MTAHSEARARIIEAWRRSSAVSPSAGRRAFLRAALSLAALGMSTSYPARLRAQVPFDGYPFSLGVASGSPSASGVVLWTRLAPDPLNGGGMPPEDVAVRWEVATDSGFSRIVQSGTATARASAAHSVHVEVEQLEPLRVYWYR